MSEEEPESSPDRGELLGDHALIPERNYSTIGEGDLMISRTGSLVVLSLSK